MANPIVYIGIEIQIHGLNINAAELETASAFLRGWIKTETKAALLGNQRELFKWRNEFDEDIEVEITEHAGGK